MSKRHLITCAISAITMVAGSSLVRAADGDNRVEQSSEPVIVVDGVPFLSWQEYTHSDLFRRLGLRCGTPPPRINGRAAVRGGGPEDCTFTLTFPHWIYGPSIVQYRIPVVVHVIRQDNGTTGHVSEALIESQIDILNEDFLALPGTNGAAGTDIQIGFYLATTDPNGNATNGITYSNNTLWFDDHGDYWDSLAWDTNRYLNIYTNTAKGALGYVSGFPQGGIAGLNSDRVVILWSSFGRDASIGPPFDQGRTATHEVGHYLGLFHTFSFTCPSPSDCYTNGDLICDTNPQDRPTTGCNSFTCVSPDPIHNYLDYSDDLCMEEFTPEQARRMRCSLENYRPDLYEIVLPANCDNDTDCDDGLFCSGIEECNGGVCQTGLEVDCDDGLSCTEDACKNSAQSCVNTPIDSVCDNGLFCDGAETCDTSLDCQPGSDPCPEGPCDDDQDFCGFIPEPPLKASPPFDIDKARVISISFSGEVSNRRLGHEETETWNYQVEWLDLVCQTTGKQCTTEADCKVCDVGGMQGDPCSIDSDCEASSCVPSGEACVEQSPPIVLGWVSEPFADPGDAPPGTLTSTVVAAMPAARAWFESVIHIADCEIAPMHSYAIRGTMDGLHFSDPLVVRTTPKPQGKAWGDLIGSFDGTEWTPPNFLVNVNDVMAMIRFLTDKPAPHITVVDLAGAAPTYTNFIVNATDLQMVLEGFGGKSFPPAALTGLGYPADGDVTQCP